MQFGALDHSQRDGIKKLPVVCAIGINYSQQKIQADTNNLFPYQGGYQDLVAFYTGCYGSTAQVIAAYNRNKMAWENPPPIVEPRSPNGRYGSVNATDKCQLLATNYEELKDEGFLLIMTNLCPFVTIDNWNETPDPKGSLRKALLKEFPMQPYLEELFDQLGEDVDLWIGHSAIDGTEWVWPSFLDFVQQKNIASWLLTLNINPRGHLSFDGAFRRRNNPRFPLFGPEKTR